MCASIRITTTRGTKLTLSADQRIMGIYDKAECKGKNNLSLLLTMTLFDLRATSRSKHVAALSADPGLYSYLLKKKKSTLIKDCYCQDVKEAWKQAWVERMGTGGRRRALYRWLISPLGPIGTNDTLFMSFFSLNGWCQGARPQAALHPNPHLWWEAASHI